MSIIVDRKSAHVCWLSFERACNSRFLLTYTVSKMKQRQQTMLSFLSTDEKSITLGITVNIIMYITCYSSSEKDDKTIFSV